MSHVADVVIRWLWYGFVAVWLVMAFRTKRTLVRSGGPWRIAVLLVVVVALSTRSFRSSSWQRPLWAQSSVVSIVDLALVAIGVAFAVWARFTIGANWSGDVTFKEDHELIQRGPYALVRHPIYTGIVTMAAGVALQWSAPLGFVLFVVLVALFVVKMRMEEKLMSEHFPDQYREYRRTVKAIIPFVL